MLEKVLFVAAVNGRNRSPRSPAPTSSPKPDARARCASPDHDKCLSADALGLVNLLAIAPKAPFISQRIGGAAAQSLIRGPNFQGFIADCIAKHP
jgi:hypothetical protein